MLLNITNNFSKNVNMVPEMGKVSCVTHLFIDTDQISENQMTVKMANFELNIDDFSSAFDFTIPFGIYTIF